MKQIMMRKQSKLGSHYSQSIPMVVTTYQSVDGSLELKLRRLFQYCDANGDGLITRQDIRNTLSKWQHIPASIEESLAKFTENTYNEDEFLEKCMAINKMI